MKSHRPIVTVVTVLVITGSVAGGIALALPSGQNASEAGGALAELGGQAEANETAAFRFVHGLPATPNVDVLVDNETVFSNVSYGTVTDYTDVSVDPDAGTGEHTVTVVVTGNESVVLSRATYEFSGGVSYSVTAGAAPEDEIFGELFIVQLLREAPQPGTSPGEGDASVQLVHLSLDAPAVDVTVAETGTVLFDNVTTGNASDFATVPAGDYTLEVRAGTPENDGPVVKTFDVSLESGTAYTAYAIGFLNPEGARAENPFDLVVAPVRPVAPAMETATETTTVTETATATETTTAAETTTETETTTEM